MGMGITQVTLSHLMPSFSLRNKELGVQCPVLYFVLQLSRVWMNSPLSCTHTQFAHEGDIQMIILTAFSSCFFSDRIKMYPDPLNTHPGREPPAPTPTPIVRVMWMWNLGKWYILIEQPVIFNYQGLEPSQPFIFFENQKLHRDLIFLGQPFLINPQIGHLAWLLEVNIATYVVTQWEWLILVSMMKQVCFLFFEGWNTRKRGCLNRLSSKDDPEMHLDPCHPQLRYIYRSLQFRNWLYWMKETCQDWMCTLFYVLSVFFSKKNIYTLCFVSKCFLNALSQYLEATSNWGASLSTFLGS